ncbi:MAG: hypothetical protein WC761_01470 [Candidatus Paceibacterota bacterium]|jgi:hypothetical protein
MSLFDEMLKNEEYRKMFDQLSDDERPILMDSIRKLVEQVEKAIIIPIENSKG